MLCNEWDTVEPIEANLRAFRYLSDPCKCEALSLQMPPRSPECGPCPLPRGGPCTALH